MRVLGDGKKFYIEHGKFKSCYGVSFLFFSLVDCIINILGNSVSLGNVCYLVLSIHWKCSDQKFASIHSYITLCKVQCGL